jgi:hypothetical protein
MKIYQQMKMKGKQKSQKMLAKTDKGWKTNGIIFIKRKIKRSR